MAKGNLWTWVVIGAIVAVAFGWINLGDVLGGQTSGGTVDTSAPTYQPTASYATFDKFGTASVAGTSYYKEGGLTDGLPASTTAITNTNKGKTYTYWVSNSSQYYVKPTTFTASVTDNVVNKESYSNSSAPTITTYDLVGRQTVDAGVANISVGANGEAKVEITYLGAAKQAQLPFGGVMVMEYDDNLTSVTCSGDGIVGLNSKYQVTYTTQATTNAYKVYEVASGFDVSANGGSTGVTKVIKCEFVNGATDFSSGGGANANRYTFIPANYYVGNDGNVYLDTEQKMNGVSTRTGFASPTAELFHFS